MIWTIFHYLVHLLSPQQSLDAKDDEVVSDYDVSCVTLLLAHNIQDPTLGDDQLQEEAEDVAEDGMC